MMSTAHCPHCPAALIWISKGPKVPQVVFFCPSCRTDVTPEQARLT